MLLSVHGSPCKLGRLQLIMKVMLALGVDEQEHLRVRSDKSDSSSWVNLVATETTKLRPDVTKTAKE